MELEAAAAVLVVIEEDVALIEVEEEVVLVVEDEMKVDMEAVVEVVTMIVMVADVAVVLVAVGEVVLMTEEAMVTGETEEDLSVVGDLATEEDAVPGVDTVDRVMIMGEMVVEVEEVVVVVIEVVEVTTEEVVEEDEARGLELIRSHDPTIGHAMAVATLILVSDKNAIDVTLLDLVVATVA